MNRRENSACAQALFRLTVLGCLALVPCALYAQSTASSVRNQRIKERDMMDREYSLYHAGEAPITEVVDAQNLLITQRQSLYKAIFDYQTAKSHLAHAVGR